MAAVGRAIPAAVGSSPLESDAARPEAGFRRCRATATTPRGGRVDSQFRARSGTAPVADIDPQQATVDAGPGAPASPNGILVGGCQDQTSDRSQRSAGGQ